jgi:ABC-type xylose transport system permease subunit
MTQRSIGAFIVALGGLLVWAAHFALLYGGQTAFCTGATAGWSATGLRIAGLALTAAAVAVLLVLAGRPRLHSHGGCERGRAADAESARFLRHVGIACAALALLAMLWATIPLLLLPACGPAAV